MKHLKQAVQLQQIISALGGELQGAPDAEVTQIESLDTAHRGGITFLANPKYLPMLHSCQATVVILKAQHATEFKGNKILAEDPYLYFAELTQWWKQEYLRQESAAAKTVASHSTGAHIHETAKVAASATICAGAVIDAGAHIGEHAYIGSLSYIGKNVVIGAHTRIAPNVSILDYCKLGQRTIINSGAVIGGDGFGFAPSRHKERKWTKIEQLGAVIIGDDVEIGANTCIDRGAIDDTIIGDGVKLDNVIQIAHNVHVGNDSLMASCVGISGSTHIGQRCVIGGAVGTAGHLTIVDDVTVMAATNVTKSITAPGQYSGIIPFDEASAWRKNAALLRHLSSMRDRIRNLEKQIEILIEARKVEK